MNECQWAFDVLKEQITSAPILTMAWDEGLMKIEADACQFAVGGILSQEQNGVFKPVTYYSKSLMDTEQNYDIHDRELLTIIKTSWEWQHYVVGKQVKIWTDHKNLEYFMVKRDLNWRQARWSTELVDYNFTLHCKKGSSMRKADILSRRPDLGEGVENDNKNITLLPPFENHELQLWVMTGVVLGTLGDIFVKEVRETKEEYGWKVQQRLEESHDGRKASDGAVWEKTDGLVARDGLIVIPKDRDLHRRIIAAHHDAIMAGHPGQFKTQELIKQNYYWEGLTHDIKTYINGCQICPKIKPSRRMPMGELVPTQIPERPWKIITMDLIGPLLMSWGHNTILNVVDRHSKLLYSLPCHETITAEGITRLFQKEIWPHEGIPEQIITDRGPQFMAAFMKELYQLLKITGAPSTTYHPQTDGQIEQVNQEVEVYLRAFINHHQDDWEDWLPAAVFSWNSKPGSTTRSPFKAMKGYQPTMGPEPSRKGKEREAGRFVEDMKRSYDCGRRPNDLKIGDRVWLDTQDLQTDRPNKKLHYKRVGPFEIISKHGPMAYKLWLPKMYKVHPIFPAIKLTKAKDDEWERPVPKVTLKVWDPATGEFVWTTEQEQVEGIWLSPETFNEISWRLNPETYPNQTTTPWH